jgi:hypothetical protein
VIGRRVGLVLLAAAVLTAPAGVRGDDRRWENPEFESVEASIEAARACLLEGRGSTSRSERVFVDFNLAAGDLTGSPKLASVHRKVVDRFLLTYPAHVEEHRWLAGTLEAFLGDMLDHRDTVHRRMHRFGFPELDGLVYLKLVDNVDHFGGFGPKSTDPMSRVGGLTLYCRYILLPLSYISADSLAALDRAALRNPSLDREETLRQWRHESYTAMVNTFRHELVHVHTNTALDLPLYSDRRRYPVWFHEGTATYLAGDPHAGLSVTYQEYQNLFFYLAERFGVRQLAELWSEARTRGETVAALEAVYGIGSHHELSRRSIAWHERKQVVRAGVWIVLGGIVLLALFGARIPLKGSLLLVLAAVSAYGTVSGFAERVSGLAGPTAVLGHKLVLVALAIALATAGVLAVRRYYCAPEDEP